LARDTSGIGTPLDEKAVWRHFRAICARAGVAPIRIHDLRHTSATLLLAAGVSPKVVSERLGHSNVDITLNVYSHVGATLQQAAADTLDAMLRQGNREGALANG
jgi:integrase